MPFQKSFFVHNSAVECPISVKLFLCEEAVFHIISVMGQIPALPNVVWALASGAFRIVSDTLVFDALFASHKGGGICFCPCLFVCLSVSEQDYSKTRGFGSDAACRQMSGHGRTD